MYWSSYVRLTCARATSLLTYPRAVSFVTQLGVASVFGIAPPHAPFRRERSATSEARERPTFAFIFSANKFIRRHVVVVRLVVVAGFWRGTHRLNEWLCLTNRFRRRRWAG